VEVEEEVVVVVAAAEVEKVDKGVEAACASPRTRYLSPLTREVEKVDKGVEAACASPRTCYLSPLTRYRSLLLPPAYPSKVFRLT
jgi:hypothetical protein